MRVGDPGAAVTRVPRGVLAAALARSFLIQGSWNYRTLIGSGFAFALLPVLRVIYRDDEEALHGAIERHMGLFNSHPYLSSLALGAVAALEAEGEEPAMVERYKTALRGSLGMLGDRLVWVGWRPVCLLAAICLIMAGASWWVSLLIGLVLFNAGQIALRIWGLRLGWRHPRRIGEQLRRSPIARMQEGLLQAGSFLVGLALPFLIVGAPVGEWAAGEGSIPEWLWWTAAGVGALLGIRLGRPARTIAVLLLVAFVSIGIFLGLMK